MPPMMPMVFLFIALPPGNNTLFQLKAKKRNTQNAGVAVDKAGEQTKPLCVDDPPGRGRSVPFYHFYHYNTIVPPPQHKERSLSAFCAKRKICRERG
jgi:hypothetical protein